MTGGTYTPPPPKPRRMSQQRYRELYDSDPCTVVVDGTTRYRCAGPVSAEVLAVTFRTQGRHVEIIT